MIVSHREVEELNEQHKENGVEFRAVVDQPNSSPLVFLSRLLSNLPSKSWLTNENPLCKFMHLDVDIDFTSSL